MDLLRKLFKSPGPVATVTWEPVPELRGKLGERYFQAMETEERLREEVWEALFNAVGYAYPGELGDLPEGGRGFVPPWPLQDITFDPYDSSFEFKGCTPAWTPTAAQLDACLALGFERCWVCWADGTESYYGGGGKLSPRRARP